MSCAFPGGVMDGKLDQIPDQPAGTVGSEDNSLSARDRDDLTLLEAWRAGQLQAGNKLVHRYHEELLNFIYSHTHRNRDASLDLLQEVFEAAIINRSNIKTSFRAYIYKIARRKLNTFYTKHTRKTPLSKANLADGAPSLASIVQRSEEENFLVKALRRLPLDDQIIFSLRLIEGLKLREVAEILECTMSAVGGKEYRARKRLSQIIAELTQDPTLQESSQRHLQSWYASVHRKWEQ